MRTRPFALLGASVVNEVSRRITKGVEAWRSEWGLDNLPVDVECMRAWEASSQHRNNSWQLRCGTPGKSVWLGWQPELERFLQRQMFPSDQRHLMQSQSMSSIAAEGAEAAVKAMVDRIAQAFACQDDGIGVRDTTGPEENAFIAASGALLVRIKLGEQTVTCLIDHECVRTAAGHTAAKPAEPIVRGARQGAFNKIPVTLPIEIGQVEVDVGNLLTLAVGDVIRLNTSVDRPLSVYGPGQQVLFNAHLGALEGKIAVEVVRRSNLQI